MEACFLCSNAFSKTLEPACYFKPRTSTFSRRNASVFQCGKGSHSFSVCCSQHGSPSSTPRDDQERPSVSADWRSFRARLIAAEQALTISELSVAIDPDKAVEQPPPTIPIGDKWVHSIHEPEKGCLLIATEKLDGVHIFEKTVVLLLSVGPIGPIGLILNRPSLMSIKELKSSSSLDISGIFSERSLFFGGPLEEGLFLLGPKDKESNDSVEKSGVFEEVMNGLYYGTKENVGCGAEMVKRDVVGVDEFRFFDGYCAWEKEQLRDEIRAGYWTVAACSPTVIGLSSVGSAGLWEEVLELMGPRKVW
ncbi:transporter [Lithospermum erythrorhizon]|uniref:Transporter n=1 Tax=Lithospermum erythrorhizon TaxID=34254 RepID=A0AAV3PYI0_LITER